MRVWIDQDLCTGDGLCEDHCADAFKLLEDGIAYVAELGVPMNDPGGAGSLARVAPRDRQSFAAERQRAGLELRSALENAFSSTSATRYKF